MRSPRQSTAAGFTCLLIGALLCGCSSVSDQLRASVKETNSAVQTARIGITLHHEGRSTKAVTGTVLLDALGELSSAEKSTTELDAPSNSDARARQRTLDLIRQSTDAVNQARKALAAGEPLTGPAATLKSLGDRARERLTRSEPST